MSAPQAIDLLRSAIWVVMIVAAPPLILGLLIGLVVSIFQTVTSIQEATLSFVPKIVAVFFALIIFGDFMLTTLLEFMVRLYSNISSIR